MQVQNISFTGYHLNIPRNLGANKQRTHLYNEVSSLIEEHKMPAIIKNEGIDLPRATQDVLKKLKEMNIRYEEIK